jgi:hypothetical protein
MLSSTLSLAPGGLQEAGKHPMVIKLLRGVYHSNPPCPKYAHTWDPAIVLSHLSSSASSKMSVMQLSRKTSTLLALTSLLRCAEMAAIQAQSISFTNSGVTFILGNLRKAQRAGPLHKISIKRWPDDLAICPVATLEDYIKRMLARRNDVNKNTLFLSTTKPFQPVSSSTIGRWIKDQLKSAGVDTNIYTAHSTRGAAASKSAASGVPIQAILKQGHWSRESTFARFYQREIQEPADLLENGILGAEMTESSSE